MKKVLYVAATLPALTVTFIYKEIGRLTELGLDVDAVSMNTPNPDRVSAEARHLRDSTLYLDRVGFGSKLAGFCVTVLLHPLRTLSCFASLIVSRPVKGVHDYARLSYHLFEAAFLARQLKNHDIEHIHCHFINGPTSIGMYLAKFLRVPYSFTMHASMIWIDPIAFRNKLGSCEFCVSISEYNKQYVLDTYGDHFADKIHVVHCGIDEGIPVPETPGGKHRQRIQFLGVGQLNRRKGFHVLLDACKLLNDRSVDFHCTIVGDGDEMDALVTQRGKLGLKGVVTLKGAVLHEQVSTSLNQADVFVLPCVISEDGWRDGIPVAIMEAMCYQVPAITTSILGLPELIEDEESGLLVEANDPEALANAMQRLALDEDLRASLGAAGRSKVLSEFNNRKSANKLYGLFHQRDTQGAS